MTERQRLELYELRNAALREIHEFKKEKGNDETDPYLKKYLKSIDELLRKAGCPVPKGNSTYSNRDAYADDQQQQRF